MITRNHVRYVRQCIESIVEQAGNIAMEILVGDDCSVDGTSSIIAEFVAAYPHLITHIRHDPQIGGSENFLHVLRQAKGTFIANLDGDDYWMPGKLQRQVDYLLAHPDCAAVYANSFTVNEQGNPIGRFNDATGTRFEFSDLLRHGNFLNSSSMMFRASLRQMILDIDGPALDYRIHLGLARSGYLAQLADPLAVYRVNSIGSTVAQANDFVRELYWEAIQSVPRELVSDDDYAHGLADFLRRIFFRAVRTRDMSLYRTWATRVYAASPYGRAHTSVLVATSIFRIGGKALWGQRARLVGRSPPRILYRR